MLADQPGEPYATHTPSNVSLPILSQLYSFDRKRPIFWTPISLRLMRPFSPSLLMRQRPWTRSSVGFSRSRTRLLRTASLSHIFEGYLTGNSWHTSQSNQRHKYRCVYGELYCGLHDAQCKGSGDSSQVCLHWACRSVSVQPAQHLLQSHRSQHDH